MEPQNYGQIIRKKENDLHHYASKIYNTTKTERKESNEYFLRILEHYVKVH